MGFLLQPASFLSIAEVKSCEEVNIYTSKVMSLREITIYIFKKHLLKILSWIHIDAQSHSLTVCELVQVQFATLFEIM